MAQAEDSKEIRLTQAILNTLVSTRYFFLYTLACLMSKPVL